MKTLKGATKFAFLAFFVSHIPITLLVDSQALLQIHPKPILDLVAWYSSTFKDELMSPPYQTWFTAIVTCELLFQVPFFFVAVYALLSGKVSGKGWFRSSCLIYGAHTCTTLVPIFACIWKSSRSNVQEKLILTSFYVPYFIFPFWLMCIAFLSEDIFGKTKQKRG